VKATERLLPNQDDPEDHSQKNQNKKKINKK
jgi:hypothetical protein